MYSFCFFDIDYDLAPFFPPTPLILLLHKKDVINDWHIWDFLDRYV